MKRKFLQMEPSLIAASWGCMAEEAKSCEKAGAQVLHLDVMDGQFVPNLTMGPDMVAAIRKAVPDLTLDVHLMIYSPENYIERFVEAGADEITFHVEATEEIEHTIDYITKCNRKVGLALKPDSSICMFEKYLHHVDKFLVMTVEPGFGGQSFMEDQLEKVRDIRSMLNAAELKKDVQVDGGINLETGRKSVEAGANLLVNGSHFFKSSDRAKTLEEFNRLEELITYT